MSRMRYVGVLLEPELVDSLDGRAEAAAVNRSEIIRRLLTSAVHGPDMAAIRAILDDHASQATTELGKIL